MESLPSAAAVAACNRFNFPDGSSYTGNYQDGTASGLGVYSGSSKRSAYSGSWKAGFEEKGVYRWPQGNYYQGQWLHGQRHGMGVELVNRWLYKGEWTQGFKGRYGVRQNIKSGAKYEGSWSFGFQEGYGVETYADGGTYQGQWLHGVRHGYGVRDSVSYDLAVRYHRQFKDTAASPQDRSNALKSNSTTVSFRDRRLEDGGAGGFVLMGDDQVKDKRNRSSLRRAFHFVRQKSAGDIDEVERDGKRSRTPGGSVRSTISTGRMSLWRSADRKKERREEEEEEETKMRGSFVSIVDASFPDDVVERYWGEWKNDKRSGYGVCERTDGVKYEGEWLDNRKNGYGVTTLRDGSRIEGKYKRNVLTTDLRTFLKRTARLKEQIEKSVSEAQNAAKIAQEKAEIANTRTMSARVKAEQAQLEAAQAEALAEAANAQAHQCTGNITGPGFQIFMNHIREEDFISPTKVELARHAHSTASSSKFLTIFRSSKKDPLQSKTRTVFDPEATFMQDNNETAKFYPTTGNYAAARVKGQHNIWTGNAFANAFDSSKIQDGQTGSLNYGGRIGGSRLGAPQSRLTDDFFKNPQLPVRSENATSGQQTQNGVSVMLHNLSSMPEGTVKDTGSSLAALGVGNQFPNSVSLGVGNQSISRTEPQHTPSFGRRKARAEIDTVVRQMLPSLSPVGSTTDPAANYSQSMERRKSLPSIVKDDIETEKRTTKPEIKFKNDVTIPETKTFVIEDGVRKRVTPVYGPRSPVRSLAVEGRSGLPKLYDIDSGAHRCDRGSVPDVNAAANMKVMSRETVHALNQQRMMELRREREENENRGGQIVLRLGDVTDWCARRKMLIVVLAVNYALVNVFYNMIQQQYE